MTGFLIGAAVLLAITLLFLLLPLLRRPAQRAAVSRTTMNAAIYRDQFAELERDRAAGALSQADFDQAQRELQRRLLDDAGAETAATAPPRGAKRSAVIVALTLPLAAAVLYFFIGNLAALAPAAAKPKLDARQVEEMVAKLAARMEQNPGDTKGWVMLARSYKVMGRYEEAARAYDKGREIVDKDAQLLSDHAEALALATGGSLKGRPTELIERALKIEPEDPTALVLAGTAAYERGDFAAAVLYWERLLQQLPADSEDAQSLNESINKARAAAQKQGRKGRGPSR
jgi:cytochrome c-type biogenesis protein CcmH